MVVYKLIINENGSFLKDVDGPDKAGSPAKPLIVIVCVMPMLLVFVIKTGGFYNILYNCCLTCLLPVAYIKSHSLVLSFPFAYLNLSTVGTKLLYTH